MPMTNDARGILYDEPQGVLSTPTPTTPPSWYSFGQIGPSFLSNSLAPAQLWGQDRFTELLNGINETAMRGVPIQDRPRSQEWDDHWKAYLERQMWNDIIRQRMNVQGNIPNVNGTLFPNPRPAIPYPQSAGVRG